MAPAWLTTATGHVGARIRKHVGAPPTLDVAFYVPAVTALLIDAPAKPGGGAETQVLLLARALAASGCRVGLICYRTNAGLPDELDGVRIIPRPPGQGERRLVGFLLEVAIIMISILRVPADVYVQRVAGFHTGVVALAAKLRRRPFVYSSACTAPDFDLARWETGRRELALYRVGLALADAVVVQTEEQVDLCRSQFGRQPALIRSIAEPVAASSEPRDEFLWVGRAEPRKRPLEYVELAKAVPEATFKMVLLKQGRWWRELASEVEREAVDVPNLEILGPLPRSELGRRMERAVAVVSTSAWEGMANVLLEAWARGVPALVLHHDPDSLVEREGLGAFVHGSHERLVAETRRLWACRDDAEQSARCRAYIDAHHSANAVGGQWLAVLAGARAPKGEEARAA